MNLSQKIIFLILVSTLNSCESFNSGKKTNEDVDNNRFEIILREFVNNETRITYAIEDSGSKTLLVFVHGSPGSWNAFKAYFEIDSLIKKFDLMSVDRPGYGESNDGISEPSLLKQANSIHKCVNSFRYQNVILIGHSLGGPIIAKMVMVYPNNYDGLLLLAPSIDPELEKKEWYRSLIKTKLGSWITPKDFVTSNDEILELKNELKEMSGSWNSIETPTILIHGTKDMLVPVENADFAKRMMRNSVLEVKLLEGVNHFILWTQKEEVIKSILDLEEIIYSTDG